MLEDLAAALPDSAAATLQGAVELAWPVHLREADASPVKAAIMLRRLGADADTRVAALLAPGTAGGGLSLDAVNERFGSAVASLVKNVRWMDSFAEAAGQTAAGDGDRRSETIRRMLLTTVDDVRAVLVKLVYQLGLLQRLHQSDAGNRQRIARETLDIYAPLANRLGVAQLKWALEDLAFRECEPEAYKRVARALEERRSDREQYVEEFVQTLRGLLDKVGFDGAHVSGRAKHLYSIWRKMVRKRLEFDQLFDVRAVRVLVEDVRECYAVLGIVHNAWAPIPSEFDDYIANPKENGYRSLHTAVLGPGGRPVEVQVRTRDMDRDAELGVAAHWAYKEGGAFDQRLQQSITVLRQLLDGEGDVSQLASEALGERVYVFTPNGDVKDLPLGATPLDFAYAVHTEIGHRCRGAKVNGAIAALNRPLETGDRVEVLTARDARPSRNWLSRELGYLASSRSRAKVRAWFNARDFDENLAEGRSIIESELRRQNAHQLSAEDLVKPMRQESLTALCVALGRGSIGYSQLTGAIETLRRPAKQQPLFKPSQLERPAPC
ncbi:MAG: HD domain-containing protein, partial [Pseudomonadota bacterium]